MKLYQRLAGVLPGLREDEPDPAPDGPIEPRVHAYGARGGGVRPRQPPKAPGSRPASAPSPVNSGGIEPSQAASAPSPEAQGSQDGLLFSEIARTAGHLASCLAEGGSGRMLAFAGRDPASLQATAALNAQVLRAAQDMVRGLGLEDQVEDILLTSKGQVHLIRPLARTPTQFLFVSLDRKAANLGLARVQVRALEAALSV